MHFEFATARRIVFGPGSLRELAPAAAALGSRALLVEGVSGRHAAGVLEQLRQVGLAVSELHVSGEPTVTSIIEGVQQAHLAGCDVVIGLGGGSVLDSGKAIAALLANPGDIFDYLEVVGNGAPLTAPALAFIAVPTTAGTGTEVTRNAVLAVPERKVKVSLRSASMLPQLAL